MDHRITALLAIFRRKLHTRIFLHRNFHSVRFSVLRQRDRVFARIDLRSARRAESAATTTTASSATTHRLTFLRVRGALLPTGGITFRGRCGRAAPTATSSAPAAPARTCAAATTTATAATESAATTGRLRNWRVFTQIPDQAIHHSGFGARGHFLQVTVTDKDGNVHRSRRLRV